MACYLYQPFLNDMPPQSSYFILYSIDVYVGKGTGTCSGLSVNVWQRQSGLKNWLEKQKDRKTERQRVLE